MKVWILSSGFNGPVEDWSVTDILKGEGLKVYASRHGAEAGLDTLLLAAFNGDWQTTVDDDSVVIAEGTLLVPMGRCTTGWAGIAAQDVIEDELLSVVGSSEEKRVLAFGPSSPAPHGWNPAPAVGDTAVLHKPGSEDSSGWRVTDVSPEKARVEIERGGSVKHLEQTADGRWAYPRDVWATFEPPKSRMPAKGDSAVLHDEKTGSAQDGWAVEYVSSGGAKVSITRKNVIKHLDRLPDGRWHHAGGVYATFEPAQRTGAWPLPAIGSVAFMHSEMETRCVADRDFIVESVNEKITVFKGPDLGSKPFSWTLDYSVERSRWEYGPKVWFSFEPPPKP